MNPEVRDQIVKHAFESLEWQRISILVHFAFPSIKTELIRRTLVSIQNRVSTGIGPEWSDWLSEVHSAENQYYLRFRKRLWPDGRWIGLESKRAEEGKFLYIFAGWWPEREQGPEDEELRRVLTNQLPEIRPGQPGRSFSWWGFPRRYRSWDSEETLVALAATGDAIDYFGGVLFRLCQNAEKVIDTKVSVSL